MVQPKGKVFSTVFLALSTPACLPNLRIRRDGSRRTHTHMWDHLLSLLSGVKKKALSRHPLSPHISLVKVGWYLPQPDLDSQRLHILGICCLWCHTGWHEREFYILYATCKNGVQVSFPWSWWRTEDAEGMPWYSSNQRDGTLIFTFPRGLIRTIIREVGKMNVWLKVCKTSWSMVIYGYKVMWEMHKQH